jgi:hypothetical protein
MGRLTKDERTQDRDEHRQAARSIEAAAALEWRWRRQATTDVPLHQYRCKGVDLLCRRGD